MLAAERRQRLIELARQRPALKVTDLVREFGITPNTARADLRALDAEGVVRCTHGGAVPIRTSVPAPPYAAIREEHLVAKTAIGRAAAALLPATGQVYLNAGSTSRAVALHLPAGCRLEFGTNSPEIALLLTAHTAAAVDLFGGRMERESRETDGRLSLDPLRNLFWDTCVLSVFAVDEEHGISSINPGIARLESAVLARSRHRIILCDSSKFGTFGRARVAELAAAQVIVSDAGLSRDWCRRIKSIGIEIVLAK
ncbi:MAG: DeoR/GlpR family DNA-binding transcription regulator [bacterium]